MSSLHSSTFQALFDTAPDAMIVCNAEGRIILANPQVEQLFGYQRGKMQGQAVESLIPERVRTRHVTHRAS